VESIKAKALQRVEAGAASIDITPVDSQFLYGYPHVERYSTGVHDPLFSSALCLADGKRRVVFIANDVIFVSKAQTKRVRERIAQTVGIPADSVMLTATHTHSGPHAVHYVSNEADPAVPRPDPRYVERLEDGMVEAARQACGQARPAEVGLAVADGSCVGTNRRDPSGPSDPAVPVLAVREAGGGRFIAVMMVCNMHPTVLHEDSTLVSADFPGMARRYLQEQVVGRECPVIHHTGPCGDQSPRHVTRGNTFEEAQRLGELLGSSVARALAAMEFRSAARIDARSMAVDLPPRIFPSPDEAADRLVRAEARLRDLRAAGAPRAAVRTAECDWFGAEETLALAKAAVEGRLDVAAAACLPAEAQLITIGPWSFIGWPGEVFVEFSLDVRRKCPDACVISLANGELQGYLVTAQAVAEGGYEASNAMFRSPESGWRLVQTSLTLLRSRAVGP